MKKTEDFDSIFENLLQVEQEKIYKDLEIFFLQKIVYSNAHKLNLFTKKLEIKLLSLKTLKPKDFFHHYDHFIEALLAKFPYKQHEDNYNSKPITHFLTSDLIELKKHFNAQKIAPFHFNKTFFNANLNKILELLSKYYAIEAFIKKANNVNLLRRDNITKVIERIRKSKDVPLIKKEELKKVYDNNAAQQVLIMNYLFRALNNGISNHGEFIKKVEITKFLTGKNIDTIKGLLKKPWGEKKIENHIEDLELIKPMLLGLGNKNIQQLIMQDMESLKKEMKK